MVVVVVVVGAKAGAEGIGRAEVVILLRFRFALASAFLASLHTFASASVIERSSPKVAQTMTEKMRADQ